MNKLYFNKYIYLFAFIFLFFQLNFIKAQNVEFEKAYFPGRKAELSEAKTQLDKGNKLFETGGGNYLLAIEPFTKANNFNPNNALLNYRLGVCYLYTIQKTKSIAFFEKALQLNPTVAIDLHLVLGEAYQLNYEFDKAISEYKKYQQNLSPFSMEKERKYLEKKIKECETAKDLVANPVRVFIDNLGSTVNSIYPDYSPIVNADESVLIFTSRRTDTYGGKKDPNDNKYFEDVYFSYKRNNIWTLALNALSIVVIRGAIFLSVPLKVINGVLQKNSPNL
jgi:tetratricopeptide (TPR) repeat protein